MGHKDPVIVARLVTRFCRLAVDSRAHGALATKVAIVQSVMNALNRRRRWTTKRRKRSHNKGRARNKAAAAVKKVREQRDALSHAFRREKERLNIAPACLPSGYRSIYLSPGTHCFLQSSLAGTTWRDRPARTRCSTRLRTGSAPVLLADDEEKAPGAYTCGAPAAFPLFPTDSSEASPFPNALASPLASASAAMPTAPRELGPSVF